jgi:hypothetical protein
MKAARRNGATEFFDFTDTYNPNENKSSEGRHLMWPVLQPHNKAANQEAYKVREITWDTRHTDLSQEQPIFPHLLNVREA